MANVEGMLNQNDRIRISYKLKEMTAAIEGKDAAVDGKERHRNGKKSRKCDEANSSNNHGYNLRHNRR